MKKYIFLLILSAMVLVSCDKGDEIIQQNSTNNNEQFLNKLPANAIIIAPSGDVTGVTDSDNIENALNFAKATGNTVMLSDGKPNTKDHYYTSRNIIVDGFNGTLMGEGKNKTFIHAGRKSVAEGFSTSFSPIWTVIFPHQPTAATVFQFDSPTGEVTIKKFSILVEDDAPAEPHLDYYGDNGTHIWTALELIGGFFNTTIEDIRIEGKETFATGNEYGFNLAWGIHVMPFGGGLVESWPPPKHQGTLTIRNIDVENLAYDALLFMDYRDGSEILVDQVSAKNVGFGVSASRIIDSNFSVSDVTVSNHQMPYAAGMFFWNILAGPTVTDCTIIDAKEWFSIVMFNAHNATIKNNTFINVQSQLSAIGLWDATNNRITQNDFKDSGLLGWTDSSNGPGAIFINGFSSDNYVHEMKFPPSLTVCDMVRNFGSNNTVHNWESCSDYAAKTSEMAKESTDISPQFPMHRAQFR